MAIVCRLGSGDNTVALVVHARQFPDADDPHDRDWLFADLEVRAGGVAADITREFVRSEELAAFLRDLQALQESLDGHARLEPLEEWFELTVRCGAGGSVSVEGVVLDRPSGRNRLDFSLEGIDQTHLPPFIDGLRAAVEAFPVVGAR